MKHLSWMVLNFLTSEALSALLVKDDVEFGPTMMVTYFLPKKLEIC